MTWLFLVWLWFGERGKVVDAGTFQRACAATGCDFCLLRTDSSVQDSKNAARSLDV